LDKKQFCSFLTETDTELQIAHSHQLIHQFYLKLGEKLDKLVMKKKVIILIRREREYYLTRNTNVFTWNTGCFRALKERVEAWNFFFKMKYDDFKTKLSEIAYLTILRNNMDALYLWSDWDSFSNMGEDTWIVPIDEDDWVFPNMVDVIREEENHPVYYWKSIHISREGNTETQLRGIDGCIPSCSYSLQLPSKTIFIRAHGVTDKKYGSSFHLIDQVLTVQVKSIGSVSSLVWYTKTIEEIRSCVKRRPFLKNTEELKGFSEEIKKYNEVLAELYDSCKI
jgi:hypothetical protein